MSIATSGGRIFSDLASHNGDQDHTDVDAASSALHHNQGDFINPNRSRMNHDHRSLSSSTKSRPLSSATGHNLPQGERGERSYITTGLHSPNGITTFAEPGYAHGSLSNNLRQLEEAQYRPLMPTFTAHTTMSSLNSGNSRAVSPAGRLEQELDELRQRQENARINIEGPPRTPERADFPPSLFISILPPATEPDVEHCIVLLHHSTGDENSLSNLAKNLRRNLGESAFILIRGLRAVSEGNSGYHWADSDDDLETKFIQTSTIILEQVIKDGLMAKCGFHPQSIIILGHGEGGRAALATAASWNGFEFGGVVSVGGRMPNYVQLESGIKAKTPALIVGGALGEISATDLQRIQENFIYTDKDMRDGAHDVVPESQEQLQPLWDFFAHRLKREEWNKQAVVSFDGGGVRGLGSLLILQDLMNKIGDLEKSLGGPEAESSFAPREYRPMAKRTLRTDTENNKISSPSGNESPVDPEDIVPTPTDGVPNSSLFLPCHYFNYAAGTSTGGLISIMLSRLRMTVDECIEEYKTLGDKIFGHPRPISSAGTLWHRLDCKVFEKVIRDVTARYSERSRFESHYAMDRSDQDMCQCIVLAYADNSGGDAPYLFRTYPTPTPQLDRNRTVIRSRSQALRNHGDAHGLPIWQVARATSAAPGYFPPMKIRKGNGSEVITFKDGGFGSNNPSEEAYHDIADKHLGSKNMGPFISIGTGDIPLKMFAGRKRNLKNIRNTIANAKTVLQLPSRTAKAHENMIRISNFDGEERFPYYRFDGGERLGEVGLGEWKGHRYTSITGRDKTPGSKTLAEIEAAAAIYLQRSDVQQDLREVAKILVERRRLRIRHDSDWDRYASFSYYECDFRGCHHKRINTAQKFKEHIRKKHRHVVDDRVLEAQLKEKRRIHWVYRPKCQGSRTAAEVQGNNPA